MGLSRTVSEIDSDFSRKSQIFVPLVFCVPVEARGFPWNWVPAWGQKTRMMALPGRQRSLTVS